jgi:hypothetical protein
VNFSSFLCLASCLTRSSACVTLSRCCARRVLCWSAFPLAPALRSTGSEAGCPALFVGFFATIAGSDFSCPCIIGYGSSPLRCGPVAATHWSDARSPSSRTRSLRTCRVLRPRRAKRILVMTRSPMLPSALSNASAPRTFLISRLDGGLVRTPADASPVPSRMLTHGSGRCGSLLLHRSGLSPLTPRQSPGAPTTRIQA